LADKFSAILGLGLSPGVYEHIVKFNGNAKLKNITKKVRDFGGNPIKNSRPRNTLPKDR